MTSWVERIENPPWWVDRCLNVWSTYGVLLTTGRVLLIAKVTGFRHFERQTWVDFEFRAPTDVEAHMTKMKLWTTATFGQPRRKTEEAMPVDPDIIIAVGESPRGSIALDKIVAVMEMIDAQ